MNLLDSSGWLEYFTDGLNADYFAPVALDTENLIVPVICLYEVFKVIRREKNKSCALQAIAILQQGNFININQQIALLATEFSHQQKPPMADSLIYITAKKAGAIL